MKNQDTFSHAIHHFHQLNNTADELIATGHRELSPQSLAKPLGAGQQTRALHKSASGCFLQSSTPPSFHHAVQSMQSPLTGISAGSNSSAHQP